MDTLRRYCFRGYFGLSSNQMSNILYQIESTLPEVEITPSGVSGIKAKIRKELDFWKGKTESDTSAYDQLNKYWTNVGKTDWTPTSVPWSAAWVSYQLRSIGFPARAAHYQYLQDVVKGLPNWYAVSLIKQPNIPLNEGDIVLYARGSGTPDQNEYYFTHGDIVYDVSPTQITTVGGNLGDKVKVSKRLKAENGNLISPTPYVIALKRKKKFNIGWVGLLALSVGGFLFWKRKKK